jgi:prepilin-type N-terminal cleavage/methylation domain-containing protein
MSQGPHGLPRPPSTLQQRQERAGFSITELMIVIAIIGVINGLAIVIGGNGWQRERVNTVALGLAGWLEEVRGNSLRQISDDPAAGGCVVSINSLSSAPVSTALASVSPSNCASNPSFAIPGATNTSDRYTTSSSATTITFTPRGSVTSSSDTVVKIMLLRTSQLRCVRVSAILGLIRVGYNSSASSTADSCSDYSRF